MARLLAAAEPLGSSWWTSIFVEELFYPTKSWEKNGRKMGWNMGYFFLFFFLFKLDTCLEEMWLKLQLTMDGLLRLDSLVGVFRDMK